MREPSYIFQTIKTPELDALAEQARSGINLTKQGRAAWIEGTFQLGNALAEARKRLPANQDFSDWLQKEKMTLSKDERAALIYIANHADESRKLFELRPELWSWRLIWSELSRPRSPTNTELVPPVLPGHGVVSHSEGRTESQRAGFTVTDAMTAAPAPSAEKAVNEPPKPRDHTKAPMKAATKNDEQPEPPPSAAGAEARDFNVKEPSVYKQVLRLLPKLTDDERAEVHRLTSPGRIPNAPLH